MFLKRYKGFLIFSVFFILFSALMLFTFYDFETSSALYRGDVLLSKIFAYIGKLPAFLVLLFASVVLERCCNIDYSSKSVALTWVYRCIAFLASFLLFEAIVENLFQSDLFIYLTSAVGGLLLSFICIFASHFIKRQKFITFEKWSFFSLVTILFLFVTVTVLKLAVGRPRFNEIGGLLSLFKPVYQFSFFGDGNSFPSGHTAFCCGLLFIPSLISLFTDKKLLQYFLYAFAAALILLCGISRVVAGDHYMTDILASFTISLAYFFLFKHLFYKNNRPLFDHSTRFQKAFQLGIV